MNLFQALILGMVQGLTEFLPISSTAHLKVVPVALGWGDPGVAVYCGDPTGQHPGGVVVLPARLIANYSGYRQGDRPR
ncbi:undecaprenyl-diphosphate phosphatase [Neosynechococcus sphagnicola]|uniref:undecaprenyl-diphosphate phosphatase n=1 Tax=Neosynechococcus sphagnicola TaxID=1501145 RepID=UPI0030841CD6